MVEIEVGSPVEVVNALGLESYGLNKGDKGWVNSLVHVPDEGSYIMYMPEDSKGVLVMNLDRVKFDEDRANLVLDKDTIHKNNF
jgi:hypothetical protein